MTVFTDVSNLSLSPDGDIYGFNWKQKFKFDGRQYSQPKQPQHTWLSVHNPVQCCGMRTLAGMSVFLQAEEFQTREFLEQVTRELDKTFVGGNVAFVLNSSQKRLLEPVLKIMDEMGRGLSAPVEFRNYNMDNFNYLYVWTWKGRKVRRKDGAVDLEE